MGLAGRLNTSTFRRPCKLYLAIIGEELGLLGT